MRIGSSIAFVVYCALMLAGFVFSTFFTAAPYLAFAVQLTIGFGAYVGKRLLQKKGEYNGKDVVVD